jgi:hypothetical protein
MELTTIDESWYERLPGMRERVGAGGVVVRREAGRLLVALVHGDGLSGLLIPKGESSEARLSRKQLGGRSRRRPG